MANRRELAARRLKVADEESSIRAAVTPPPAAVPVDEVAPPEEVEEAVETAPDAVTETDEAQAPVDAEEAPAPVEVLEVEEEGAADVPTEREPTVRFTVDLEKSAHRRLKFLALEAELRAVDLVRAALSLADEDEALLARIVDRAREDRAR